MSETAWLIEASGPQYWNGTGIDRLAFTRSADEAVRFSREEDAERVRCRLLDDAIRSLCTSVEHGWAPMSGEASDEL